MSFSFEHKQLLVTGTGLSEKEGSILVNKVTFVLDPGV